jgi:hypothetical protein
VLTHFVSRKTLDTALLDIAGSGIETGKRMILRVADLKKQQIARGRPALLRLES